MANLVVNGNFIGALHDPININSGWTRIDAYFRSVSNEPPLPSSITTYCGIDTNSNRGGVYQSISFPKSGNYVLSFWHKSLQSNASRLDVKLGSIVTKTYSYNAIGSWVQNSLPFYVTGPSNQTLTFDNGIVFPSYTETFGVTGVTIYSTDDPCFMEGTLISCMKENMELYVPIEQLYHSGNNYLVKTLRHGYKPIKIVGKKVLYNPGNNDRIKNRLYKLTPEKYSELFSPLYITGSHAVLVDVLTHKEIKDSEQLFEHIFVTDEKYRLFACIDERAEPYEETGYFTIYHLALETDDIWVNYGIYANGLLVESCCIYNITEKSDMELHRPYTK